MSTLQKYRTLLEIPDEMQLLTLGEGHTPLVRSRSIGPDLGLKNLFFKLETLNPTGSYKDRFAALALSGLLADRAPICLATSSGNTGAALAAYSTIANIPCHIALIDGTPMGKLTQMYAHGAHLWMLKDFGKDVKKTDEIFEGLKGIAREYNTGIQVSAFSTQPFAMQGVQTISYELCDRGNQPQDVFVPAGGGGLTLAIARGFQKWSLAHKALHTTRVHCVQPEGNDTMASAIRNGKRAAPVDKSTTTISGLQVPSILDGNDVVREVTETGGNGYLVTDQRIMEWQESLARKEGIYAEPAGAVSVAGLERALQQGEINVNDNVVCIITGHGFKNTSAAKPEVVHINEFKELKKLLNKL